MKTPRGMGPYRLGPRLRGLAGFGRVYRTDNAETGASAFLESPTRATPHRVPSAPVRVLVTQWTGDSPGTAVELQSGDPAHVVDALDTAAELAEHAFTLPEAVEHLRTHVEPVSPPGILVDEERLEALVHTANEVEATWAEMAAVRAAHAATLRHAAEAEDACREELAELRVARAEALHASVGLQVSNLRRERRTQHWVQVAALAASLCLALWPRSARDPRMQPQVITDGRGLTANTVALTSGADVRWGNRLSGGKLPRSPFDNQKRPPCKRGLEVELNGGCWVQLKQDAPCPSDAYEHQLRPDEKPGCFLPAALVERRDTSIRREP